MVTWEFHHVPLLKYRQAGIFLLWQMILWCLIDERYTYTTSWMLPVWDQWASQLLRLFFIINLGLVVVNYVLTILPLLSSGLDLLEKSLGCTNMYVVPVGVIKERSENLGQIHNFSFFLLFFSELSAPDRISSATNGTSCMRGKSGNRSSGCVPWLDRWFQIWTCLRIVK